MTKYADSNAIRNYAAECASATADDCSPEEIVATLGKTNREIAQMYLIDSGDIIVTPEQEELFGAVYRTELAELAENED